MKKKKKKSLSTLESPSKTMFTFLHQQIKSSQKSFVNGHVINKCSRDSLSAPQNVHNGEAIKPILWRKAFVVKYLLRILYWNSLDFVSLSTLKGNLYISFHSKHTLEYCSLYFVCAVEVVSYLDRISP